MSQERTEAIVLRGVDFSESSRIVTFLTPGRGRLACMAKGVRRRKSQLGPLLDTFNHIEVVYYWRDGRQVQQLADAALLNGFSAIKRNLEKASFAAFPLELVYKVAHDNEPSEELFARFVRGLESLASWKGDVRAHACWQVVQLLSAAGFEPRLDGCAACGGPIPTPPGFSYDGGAVCRGCRSDRRLSRHDYDTLCALVTSRAACPAIEHTGDVFHVLWKYAARQLDTSFRSVRVIGEMFG